MSSFLVLRAVPTASVHEKFTVLCSLPFSLLLTLLFHSSLSHVPTLRSYGFQGLFSCLTAAGTYVFCSLEDCCSLKSTFHHKFIQCPTETMKTLTRDSKKWQTKNISLVSLPCNVLQCKDCL